MKRNNGYYKMILRMYNLESLIEKSFMISFVIIFIDIFNIFTRLLDVNVLALLILLLIFLLIKIFKKNNFVMLYAKSINSFDEWILVLFGVFVINLSYIIFFDYKFYKLVLLIILLIINTILFFIRKSSINILYKKELNNVYDLKHIYENKVDISSNDIILLDEKDVDYDILNRGKIINQLYNSIIKCNPIDNFTIGLNGSWGCGKTTIINNVLRLIKDNNLNDKFLIIKFDLWKYEDKKAMLSGFLNEILTSINYEFNYKNISDLIKEIMSLTLDYKSVKFGNIFINELKSISSLNRLESVVSNYLNCNNKRLLLIIDNLDRVDAKIALLFVKFIESITDFKNSICILLYDENIINNHLKKIFTSNKNYMEKIVQLSINVPEIDTYTLNEIKNKCANNLLINGEQALSFLNDINYNYTNVRQLKRYFNSILTIDFNNNYLNKSDVANLEYIKLINADLYYEIWQNKRYYISVDRKYDEKIFTFDTQKLNNEGAEYFKVLFNNKDNAACQDILSKMFPSVSNYFNKRDLFEYTKDEYKNSIIDNRIYNTRYFDLYFTNESNDFIRLNNDVNNFINIINAKKFLEPYLTKIISNYNDDELKVFLEIFELNIGKIAETRYQELIITLYKTLIDAPKRILFLEHDSFQRCNIIISNLLSKISKSDFNKIKVHFNNPRYLINLSNIKYYINQNIKNNVKYTFDFDNFFNLICKQILKEDLDIYSRKYYKRENIWALYRYNAGKTIKYVKRHINENNIYKFISDIISISYSGKYGYYINRANIEAICPELDLDFFIKKHKKKLTEKEKFIKEVYKLYKKEDKDFEKEIYKDEYIDISL